MRLRSGAPVLVREPGHIQVGLSRPLAFTDLSAEERAFLAALEGRRVSISTAERERHIRLIDDLDRHGLLEPSHSSSVFPGVIRIQGVDPITTWLAIGLALAGVSGLSIVDPKRSTPHGRIPGFPGVGDERSLLRLLKDTSPSLRIATADEEARIEIFRGHGASDLIHARTLTARDVPHLDIVTDEEGIDIGPLIVPGQTACETCLGIEKAERDPWWPRLALQLGDPRRDAGVVVPTSAALVAAGIALREVLGNLSGREPESMRWRIPFDSSLPEPMECRPHPACGCGAPIG